jgi:hypothetical protein
VELTVSGRLVALTEKPYDAGEFENGTKFKAGTARRVYVAGGFDKAPDVIKFKEAHSEAFEALKSAGFGAEVEITCDVFGRGNRVELQPLDVKIHAAGERPELRSA